MLPATHAYLIDAALDALEHDGLRSRRALIQAGCVDEDLVRLPLVGWRVQSPGLSHTYRPGRRRGELGAESALARIERLVAGARARWSAEPDGAARRIGRALHLVGDAGVPARALGVWHPLGDPYERWVDQHLDELIARTAEAVPGAIASASAARTIAEAIDGLARRAAGHAADTTRSPWGALAYRLGRASVVIDDVAAQRQAHALFPTLVGVHVAVARMIAAGL